MQTQQTTAGRFMTSLHNILTYWNRIADRWDRVYLCSAAPLSAELVRDYEEAQLYHPQY